MQLAKRGLGFRLAVIAAPAGQRPLRRMGAQACRAQGQQKRRFAAALASRERDGDRGSLEDRRRLIRLQADECGAELCDIPPGDIIK